MISAAPFQLLRAFSFAALAVLACSGTLSAQTLVWNANTESNLAGYIVQYGTQSGSPSTSIDVGRVTSRTITGLAAGTTYYFRVVAYNTTGQQSAPSTQVTFTPATSSTTAPTLSSVSPASGPTSGGTLITLTGANFTSSVTVRVGGVAASSVTRVSASQVTALTPAGTAGARDVQITNSTGQSAVRVGGFTYTTTSTTALTATSVAPLSGPTSGGTVVTVNGTGFVSGATVAIGGTAATGVTFLSSTQLRATTPAKAAGGYSVVVRNPNGQTANTPVGFTYTTSSTTALTATSMSPQSGPTSGGTVVTVNGTGFVSGATVTIGGTAATGVTFLSSTQLRATTPAKAAGGYGVVVRNPNGQTASTPVGFTYTASTTPTPTGQTPAPTAISPLSGPTTGGTLVTVTGSNFVSGATIKIGGKAATSVTFVNSSTLTARTPAMPVGGYPVQVFNPDGKWGNTSRGFTYTSGTSATAAQTLTSASTSTESLSASSLRAADATATAAPAGTSAETTVETLAVADAAAADAAAPAPADATAAPSAADGTFRRYLAEGVQNAQMHTQLAIANAQEADAHATLTFATTTGAQTQLTVDVPARSRRTVDLSTVPELAGASFSTLLESDRELALDRLISFDAQGSAASLAAAVDQPSATWYFAEGSTVDPQELFYLVQNPGTTEARVQVRYLLPNGAAPVLRTYTVAAGSRATIWVDHENGALASTDVAAEITSVDGTPIVVERSSYLRQDGSAAPRGGDSSTGVTAPATTWFVEGATGQYATRLLLANPGSASAAVRATYRRADGRSLTRTYTLAPNSRQTIDVATVHPSLADTTIDITVEASAPIVVERTRSWGANGVVDDAVSGAGATEGGARWLLAEAELGGARAASTDVVIFNQGAATTVAVTLLFEDGPEVTARFPVAAGARFAVPMAEAFPSAADHRFSVLLEAADPSASIVVDRAIFWRSAGENRTAGADGAATRLR